MAKILVVDDSEFVLDLVPQLLEDDGHEVLTATSWAHALKHIFKVDVVLLDVKMPGLKGDKITTILREEIPDLKAKIILFSGMDKSALEKLAEEVGADGYIQKTMDEKILMSKIRKVLRD